MKIFSLFCFSFVYFSSVQDVPFLFLRLKCIVLEGELYLNMSPGELLPSVSQHYFVPSLLFIALLFDKA